MSEENGQFYNKMPFTVKFRKTWLPNSPAAQLKHGEILDGPVAYLSQYYFLAPVPFNFHKVESVTQSQNFSFSDRPIEDFIFNLPKKEVKLEETKEIPVIINENVDILDLPFNPKEVNWLTVKIEDLKKAAEMLKIDITSLENEDKSKVKWALVKLIKKAMGMEVK